MLKLGGGIGIRKSKIQNSHLAWIILLYFTDGMPVIGTSWYRLNFVHGLSLNRTHSGGSGWTISRLVPKFFKGFNGEFHEAITLY